MEEVWGDGQSGHGWTERLSRYLDSADRGKHVLTLVGVALLAVVGASLFASSERRPERREAAAGGCSGVTLKPASRTVKRNGKMTASGTVCS